MKVILTETVESLGTAGDEVNVARGYARNYLLPKNKAFLSTAKNRRFVEGQSQMLRNRMAKERAEFLGLAEKLSGAVCTISAKVSEGDKLYGSVSVRDIVDGLHAQGFEVDKKAVMLSEPIKTLGSYIVPVRFSGDIAAEITVKVVPEQEAS